MGGSSFESVWSSVGFFNIGFTIMTVLKNDGNSTDERDILITLVSEGNIGTKLSRSIGVIIESSSQYFGAFIITSFLTSSIDGFKCS